MTRTSSDGAFSLADIRANAKQISPYVVHTPVHCWTGREIGQLMGPDSDIYLKMELFQHSGTFKARGAMTNMLALSPEVLERGVTTISAGNHAVATSWAASVLNVSAKVVMIKTANPLRVEAARAYGAEVLLAEDGPSGFALTEKISTEEGRSFVHAFEGRCTALGTATLGLEFSESCGPLDAVIIAIGGGGLAGGASAAIKMLDPDCVIYGVEPEGADSMHRSFASGQPVTIVPETIADSLAPPMSLPYSFALCRDNIDQLVKISDDDMCRAMALFFRDMKLAVEPACAAATAALTGPLKNELTGKKVGVVLCGSNIDWETFSALLKRGEEASVAKPTFAHGE